MNTDELKVVLENHKKWVNDEDGGIRINLREADLSWADLSGADLRKSDLGGADLRGADLDGSKNIMSFGPIGKMGRIGYGILHADCVMFQLGCFWGNTDEAVMAIQNKYGENSHYERMVLLVTEILEAQREK